jgi:large repetitive protein
MRRSAFVLIMMAVVPTVLSPEGVEAARTRPQPPLVFDDSFAVPEDTEATVDLPGVLGNDRTRGSGGLSAVLITRPAHGHLRLRPDGALSYTPERNFSGLDVFSYAATDGARTSEPAIVAITVTPLNDPPVAVNDLVFFSRIGGLKLRVLANDFDVDGDISSGTIGIISAPRNGRVSIGSNGVIMYTPLKGFSGSDAFTYVVWDELGARSNPAIVRIERR